MSRANSGTIRFVDLHKAHAEIEGAMISAISEVIVRGDYILGESVTRFEEEFAEYCGVTHAIGVDSGTSAIELALRAANVSSGDEVIIPANTFVATALAVHHAGATPVLVDVDPETFNIDPHMLVQAITARTRAVLPVHLYGQPASMNDIGEIAAAHNLIVVEDACQAHGATFLGRRAGNLGHIAAFSFGGLKRSTQHLREARRKDVTG